MTAVQRRAARRNLSAGIGLVVGVVIGVLLLVALPWLTPPRDDTVRLVNIPATTTTRTTTDPAVAP